MERIGLIVVDEEHDASYKHEGDPRYDARHVAARRAADHGAVLVAGSATPRPRPGTRCAASRSPSASTAPSCRPSRSSTCAACAARCTRDAHEALVDARKAIVLLNRRGWSNYLTCGGCGRAWECPSCDVTLVLHRASGRIACHHCGHRERVPTRCPDCGSVSIARHGTGTERLETSCRALGPRCSGSTPTRAAGRRCSRAFQRRRAGVLLGTQMVAKGHDFPDVDARPRRRRRPDAALPRLPRRGAHVRARRAARRARRARRRRAGA